MDRNPSWETHIPTLINGSSLISMSAYRDFTLNNPVYVPPVFQLGTAIYIKVSILFSVRFLYLMDRKVNRTNNKNVIGVLQSTSGTTFIIDE